MTKARRAHARITVGTRVSAASALFTLVALGSVSVVGGLFAAAFATTVAKNPISRPFQIAVSLGETVNSGLQYSTNVGWPSPSPSPSSVCGNKILESGETCDDGNINSCDFCSSRCQKESLAEIVDCGTGFGYICGNGVLESGEECDDGNTKSCDRCSGTCRLERTLADTVNCGLTFSAVAFRRGDANNDGRVNVADGSAIINQLTCLANADGCAADPNSTRCKINQGLCYSRPDCDDARDANDDGMVTLADGQYIFNWQLRGGPQPPAPGPSIPGPDPTADNLRCSNP